jgi:hypothetical protein
MKIRFTADRPRTTKESTGRNTAKRQLFCSTDSQAPNYNEKVSAIQENAQICGTKPRLENEELKWGTRTTHTDNNEKRFFIEFQ